MAWLLVPRSGWGQAPTIETTPVTQGLSSVPGSTQSRLGTRPGAGEMILGVQPGRDELLLGRIGTAAPRAPATIATPGAVQVVQPRPIAAPQPLRVPRAQLYGTLALPGEEGDDGPANGLTLDQAIELMLRNNLDLQSKFMEVPQARADIVTASLRANPILYADSQLIPYGSFNNRRPGGPTQYDLNISHPLDYAHKRRARIDYAERLLSVTEAQYQDAVRLEINNLYAAFVEVLAARQTLRYARASVDGFRELQRVTDLLYQRDTLSRADVSEVKAQREIAAVGVVDAEENLRRAKRTLGMLLFLPPEQAEALDLRGTIQDLGPAPPPLEELTRIALACRADVVAYRLGLGSAESGVKLAQVNRYQDAYLLYQPYTFQNNAPFGKESAIAWAVGMTFPIPFYNRNQGNIERARLNVTQSQMELAAIEQRVVNEVAQAAREYEVSRRIVERVRTQVLPLSRAAKDDRFTLFRRGEAFAVSYLQAQRAYNDNVKAYLDTAVRHRRSMLNLNSVVGQRLLP
jgi:cobalt-zinc-cadmium efflux system outer membrane protein